MMKKIELLIVIAVATLVSLFYYGPFLDNYFVWDDFIMLENFTSGNIKDVLFGFADLRLFGNLILWLNFLISGLNPIGYSLIGIGAHIANSAMLFLLIYSLSSNRLLSILTAIIFAASGVGSDAIFWKCAFLTVTGLFFYLFILYLYVEGRKRRRRAYHNIALIAFTLAMFNKEEIASIPFMIIFIEMIFFRDGERFTSKLKRVLSYFLVIVIYILLSFVISRYYVSQEQFERFLTFRPLHILFSGFTSFFISPDGKLTWEAPLLYSTALLVVFFVLLLKDKKWILFGLGWVFLTFFPQSLTSLTRFDAPYLFNSISRHLYLPSVGPAIVYSLILLSVKEHFSRKVFVVTTALFFTVFISLNYGRVNERGRQWQEKGVMPKQFLYSLKEIQPSFPEDSYVHVIRGSRSYMQRSLRAFYRNPKIYWTDDPSKATHVYLYMSGHFLDRHESFMQVVEYLKNVDFINSIIRLYDLKGWRMQKLELLRAISESAYNDPDAHFWLALIYRNMTMWDDAIFEFKTVLSIAPNNTDARYELGLVYMAVDKLDLAIKEYELVAKANSPQSMMAKRLLEDIRSNKRHDSSP